MATPTHVTLRVLQTISSIVVLGLSSYITKTHTVTLIHEGPHHLWNEVSVLVFISSLAIFTIYALEFIPYFTKKSLNQYIVFLSQALIGGLYFGTFIAMAVTISKIHHCSGSMCSILKADVVFAALGYAFFITSATIQAISMSRAKKEGLAVKEIGDVESEGGRKSFA